MSTDNVRHLTPRMSMSAAMAAFGLSARALRFYEEKGLIHAGRDRTNARYFGPEARARLQWIFRLRRAEIALKDIRDVLEVEEDAGRRLECALTKLQARRAVLLQQLEAVEAVMAEFRMTAPRAKASFRR